MWIRKLAITLNSTHTSKNSIFLHDCSVFFSSSSFQFSMLGSKKLPLRRCFWSYWIWLDKAIARGWKQPSNANKTASLRSNEFGWPWIPFESTLGHPSDSVLVVPWVSCIPNFITAAQPCPCYFSKDKIVFWDAAEIEALATGMTSDNLKSTSTVLGGTCE